MTKERELLRRALDGLENRRDEIADWGAYASEYFQAKWGYEASIDAYDNLIKEIRAHLAAEEGEPQPFNQAEFDEMVRKGTKAWKGYEFTRDCTNPSCPQNKETATRSEDVVTEATDQEPDEDWDPPSFWDLGKVRHTYTMVKQRKPLSWDQIYGEFAGLFSPDEHRLLCFTEGVRFAEKHHGISESVVSLNDTISANGPENEH